MLGNIGLVLDIIGFALMLLFNPRMGMMEGHIDEVIKTGKSVVTIPDYSIDEVKKIKRAMLIHRFGIVLIILGFCLQLINSLYPELIKTLCLEIIT
ncbi:TPA: hypothetical protein ACN30N_005084 [Vibrio campbellii]